jgi:hypothetical protein
LDLVLVPTRYHAVTNVEEGIAFAIQTDKDEESYFDQSTYEVRVSLSSEQGARK